MGGSRSRRVLIVEDEPGDAQLMRLAMQQSGYAVELDEAGADGEALRLLRGEGTPVAVAARPDLILLDLTLSHRSGLEFLAELKLDANLRAIPVVIIATSTLQADALAAYQCGAVGYVTRPTDSTEFVTTIRRLCHYWLGLVRLPESPA